MDGILNHAVTNIGNCSLMYSSNDCYHDAMSLLLKRTSHWLMNAETAEPPSSTYLRAVLHLHHDNSADTIDHTTDASLMPSLQ